jgi:hypothetical protein
LSSQSMVLRAPPQQGWFGSGAARSGRDRRVAGEHAGIGRFAAAVLRLSTVHRDGLLIAVVLNGIGWCAVMPAVFVGLRTLVAPAGRTAATVALVGATVESAPIGAALLFRGLNADAAPSLTPAAAKLVADGFALATVTSAWPTLPCALGAEFATHRTPSLPRSMAVGGVVVAAAHAVAAASVARSNAHSPSGIAVAAPPIVAAWMAPTRVALLRRPSWALVVSPAAARNWSTGTYLP